jgi:hypothetical protein
MSKPSYMRYVVRWSLVREGTRFWLLFHCNHYRVIRRQGRETPSEQYKCYRCEAEQGDKPAPKELVLNRWRCPRKPDPVKLAARRAERRKALGLDRQEPAGDELL